MQVFNVWTDPADITIVTQSPVRIAVNGNIAIECESDSTPEPEIKLEKKVFDGTWISLLNLSTFLERKGSITKGKFYLYEVNEKISGSYRCSAQNGFGVTAFSEEISVFVESIGNN